MNVASGAIKIVLFTQEWHVCTVPIIRSSLYSITHCTAIHKDTWNTEVPYLKRQAI